MDITKNFLKYLNKNEITIRDQVWNGFDDVYKPKSSIIIIDINSMKNDELYHMCGTNMLCIGFIVKDGVQIYGLSDMCTGSESELTMYELRKRGMPWKQIFNFIEL